MKINKIKIVLAGLSLAILAVLGGRFGTPTNVPDGRQEVIFWHFWGGPDRDVVEDVVHRFNDSQQVYFVRAIAMPGNNLQAKLFLSITGGEPPDLVNQDDPILADWAGRGILQSFETIGSENEIDALKNWMLPAALRLSQVNGELFGVCNGLDIRALFYNRTQLEQFELEPPENLDDLNRICEVISPPGLESREFYAFLPDSRRLWAWGFVFGADFFSDGTVRLATPELSSALRWMASFSSRYGPANVAAFQSGDPSLPGNSFPLLPNRDDELSGRYVLAMGGQWNTRDIAHFLYRRRQLGIESPHFGVCPLPAPMGGRQQAGWVNGNFFIVPKGARNANGAWEFVKFWIGLESPGEAARTCAAGGWIPVSRSVIEHPDFQQFLKQDLLFAQFVEMAQSSNQFPIPLVPGAPFFKRTVEQAGYRAMVQPQTPASQILEEAQSLVQQHLDRQQIHGDFP